jgi:phosphatidylinositol glycan class O
VVAALVGLYVFASSFFLSKHSLPNHRSECDDAPNLLSTWTGLSPESIRYLREEHLILPSLPPSKREYEREGNNVTSAREESTGRNGCWTGRRVDSVAILLVDALRIDFVSQLSKSVQSRLQLSDEESKDANTGGGSKPMKLLSPASSLSSSRLFRFVADPPTVTTQRIKALTTGGLPTFADISTNFGGATVEDDNWLDQLATCDPRKRGIQDRGGGKPGPAVGFVGDDTWLDLYPHSFRSAYPYPSFNTRDLDTVDNGCILHLPNLLDRLRHGHSSSSSTRTVSSGGDKKGEERRDMEVAVVHFLGVDHVGHTYGPLNAHMDAKLSAIDETLDYALSFLDNAAVAGPADEPSCQIVLIFGDHGMTSDGNHGGGTLEEVSAALFVHATPGCGGLADEVGGSRDPSHAYYEHISSTTNTPSIHQIDLVPTLSVLLGIPIPFANLGRVVASMLPRATASSSGARDDVATYHRHRRLRSTAAALALNAGQVWRYLNTYSDAFRPLPRLAADLKSHLDRATALLERAIGGDAWDSNRGIVVDATEAEGEKAWVEAASAYEDFLQQALELGQRVWTQFDVAGMIVGIAVMSCALFGFLVFSLVAEKLERSAASQDALLCEAGSHGLLETSLAFLFVVYHCGVLTFSNSYILEEQRSLQCATTVLSVTVALRWIPRAQSPVPRYQEHPKSVAMFFYAMLIPVASRLNELLVSGHGLDPSIRLHTAHSSLVFLPCLVVLVLARWRLYQQRIIPTLYHTVADCMALTALGASWWEKRSVDPNRTGFTPCRIALALVALGLVPVLLNPEIQATSLAASKKRDGFVVLCKLLISLLAFTGPSTAATLVLYLLQVSALYCLSTHLPCLVMATLIKLVTRHVFFATNHGCFFNRLQYSAAFVATSDFRFVTGGIALFLNTFGWEIAGIVVCQCLSRPNVWRLYVALQILEALSSCVSVSLLRRHLMVWDVYAPHFLFTSIFTFLACLSDITSNVLHLR